MEAPSLHAVTSLNLSCIDGETETTPTGAGSRRDHTGSWWLSGTGTAGLWVPHLDASSGGAGLKEVFAVAFASHIGRVFRDLCFSSLPLPTLEFQVGPC